ncbi:MAG: sugar ABC transporter permease [Aigarchaeota archaeon]|nr:sugar ABC transporter permease [Candidatus Calditenuis fumarioli]
MRLSSLIWSITVLAVAVLGSLVPLAYTLYLSFISPGGEVGTLTLKNFASVISDVNFYRSTFLSIAYTLLSLMGSLVIGVAAALVLSALGRSNRILEGLYAMPLAVSPIIAGILWSPPAVWDDINSLLHVSFGLPFIDVTDAIIYFPIMTLAESWLWSPLFMLASLIVIEDIPKECVGAARLMGANEFDLLRYLYLPSILRSNVVRTLMIIKSIDFFRAFEIPFAWSNWVRATQVGEATDTLSLLLFKQLVYPPSGLPSIQYIATVSMLLLGVSLSVAFVLFRVFVQGERS